MQVAPRTLDWVTREYGTPTFLLDLAEVKKNAAAFLDAFPGVQAYYSTKTNPDPAVIDTLALMGFRFDAATIGEIELLTRRGLQGERLLFTHPVKTAREVQTAADLGVSEFVVDSLEEALMVARVAPFARQIVRLGVAQHESTYDYRGRFGANEAEARALLLEAAERGLRIVGFSFHVGSQTRSVRAWGDATALCCRLVVDFHETLPELRAVNIGGGFPVSYDQRPVIGFADVAAEVRPLLAALPVSVRLMAEPGRAIVASAGGLVTSVEAVRTRGGARWVTVDASVYQGLIEILESNGELRYAVRAAAMPDGAADYLVGGKTLDPDDVFSESARLPRDLEHGDLLLIHDVGAYSMSLVADYHSLARPGVAYVDSGEDERVELGSTSRTGLGVLARRELERGSVAFQISGYLSGVRTRYSFELGNGLHVEPTAFGRHLNHSCAPNAGIRTRDDCMLEVLPMRRIAAGEEITVDYAMFESELIDAGVEACLCGTSTCRAAITGHAGLSPAQRRAYAGFMARHLTDGHSNTEPGPPLVTLGSVP